LFRLGDREVMKGRGQSRLYSAETEIMVDRVARIMVCEWPVRDRFGDIVGVQGTFIDMTVLQALLAAGEATGGSQVVPLGHSVGGESLSTDETRILGEMLVMLTPDAIARSLGLGRSEVEAHFNSIKRKLQCTTDYDVIAQAVAAGLHHSLFGPQLRKALEDSQDASQ
jgi:DNA-binding CsgD family transcriptional regulator